MIMDNETKEQKEQREYDEALKMFEQRNENYLNGLTLELNNAIHMIRYHSQMQQHFYHLRMLLEDAIKFEKKRIRELQEF